MFKPGDIIICIECPYCSESVYHKHSFYENSPLQVTVGHPFEFVSVESELGSISADDDEDFVSPTTIVKVKMLDTHPSLKDMVCEVVGNPEDYFAPVKPVDAALLRKDRWVPEEMLEQYQAYFMNVFVTQFDPRKGLVTRYGKVRDSG